MLDIIVAGLERLPEPGELLFAPLGVKFWIGGHPANVAIDLMQLGHSKGEVGIVACISDDLAGNFIRTHLENSGILTFLQITKNVETGRTLVLALKGRDRSFIAWPGANLHLSKDHVMKVIRSFKPDIFYIACGILGDFDYSIAEILALCDERDTITVLDAVRPYGKNWDFLRGALKYVDIMHVNADELKGITGAKDLQIGLTKIQRMGVKLPIVTDGPSGALAFVSGKYVSQPAFRVNVVDPTGAGDAFCAGLIREISERRLTKESIIHLSSEEMSKILLFAQACGAACVEAIGTTLGVSLPRIRRLIKEQGKHVLSSTIIS